MTHITISSDVRSHLQKVVQDKTTKWNEDGFYRVLTYIDEALTLYRRNQTDNRKFPNFFLDSKVKDDKPFYRFDGFDYYWFIEEFQDE